MNRETGHQSTLKGIFVPPHPSQSPVELGRGKMWRIAANPR